MSYENVPKNLTEKAVLTRGGAPDYTKLAAAAFPVPALAEAGAILENSDTGDRYRWTGTVWVQDSYKSEVVNLPVTAFGEISVANLTPVIQITAQYGLRDEVERLAIGGTVTAVDSKFVVTTGVSAGGLAVIGSTKYATYRAGQGLLARFTALFTLGVINSFQFSGIFTSENNIGFGYDGADFGILHAKDGTLEYYELTVTGAAGGAENATVTINGTPYVVAITAGTVAKNAYELAVGLSALVVGYAFSSVDDMVIVIGQIPDIGGGAFTFASATATATFAQIASNLKPIETWIPKTAWNIRPDIDIDPTLGNVFQVQLQYLGFGGIKFYIEDPYTAALVLVHVIRYANTSLVPSVNTPIFRVGWGARNLGNITNLTVQGASAAVFIEGSIAIDANKQAAHIVQAAIGTTRTSILSIQNRRTYFGTVNRAEIIFRSLALSTDTTKTAEFELIRNPTVVAGGFIEFNDLGADSLGQTSTTAVQITGGEIVAAYNIKAANPFQVDVDAVLSKLEPGDILCITSKVSSGAASEMGASLVWLDDL